MDSTNITTTYQTLKETLETLNARIDLDVQHFHIAPPVPKNTLDTYRSTLPNDLLDFYAVMNGCSFAATFNDKYELDLAICIPPIEQIGAFRNDDVLQEYRFEPGVFFLAFETAQSDMPAYFLLKNGVEQKDNYQIIKAYHLKESMYKHSYSSLHAFITTCIEQHLVYCGDVDSSGAKTHWKKQIKKAARKLTKKPKKPKIYTAGDRVHHPVFGNGTVQERCYTGKIDHYHPIWLLVHFYLTDSKIWIQQSQITALPKKLTQNDRIQHNPKAFFEFLQTCTVEECFMFISTLSTIGTICITTKIIQDHTQKEVFICGSGNQLFQYFRYVPFEDFVAWVVQLVQNLEPSKIAPKFLDEQPYHQKTGTYTLQKQDWGWTYYKGCISLLSGLFLILALHPEKINAALHENLACITLRLQTILTLVGDRIPADGYDPYYFRSNWQQLSFLVEQLSLLDFSVLGGLHLTGRRLRTTQTTGAKLIQAGLKSDFEFFV